MQIKKNTKQRFLVPLFMTRFQTYGFILNRLQKGGSQFGCIFYFVYIFIDIISANCYPILVILSLAYKKNPEEEEDQILFL